MSVESACVWGTDLKPVVWWHGQWEPGAVGPSGRVPDRRGVKGEGVCLPAEAFLYTQIHSPSPGAGRPPSSYSSSQTAQASGDLPSSHLPPSTRSFTLHLTSVLLDTLCGRAHPVLSVWHPILTAQLPCPLQLPQTQGEKNDLWEMTKCRASQGHHPTHPELLSPKEKGGALCAGNFHGQESPEKETGVLPGQSQNQTAPPHHPWFGNVCFL